MSALDILRAVHRSFYIQGTFNFERMLALGYAFCFLPFLRGMKASNFEMREILTDNLNYFNTNPIFSTWVLGGEIKLQEGRLSGADKEGPSLADIAKFRKRASQALAVHGDNLLWFRLRPLSLLFGAGVTFLAPVAGLLTTLALFNIPALYARVSGLVSGYRYGLDLLSENRLGGYAKASGILAKIGAFLVAPVSLLVTTQEVDHDIEGFAAVIASGIIVFVLLDRGVSVTRNLLTVLGGSVLAGVVLHIFFDV